MMVRKRIEARRGGGPAGFSQPKQLMLYSAWFDHGSICRRWALISLKTVLDLYSGGADCDAGLIAKMGASMAVAGRAAPRCGKEREEMKPAGEEVGELNYSRSTFSIWIFCSTRIGICKSAQPHIDLNQASKKMMLVHVLMGNRSMFIGGGEGQRQGGVDLLRRGARRQRLRRRGAWCRGRRP